MTDKYKLLKNDTKQYRGKTLYRIQYLANNSLGGYIESEANLSQHGECRVSGRACISDNARVSGNACVYGNAEVSGRAYISDNACVFGDACVSGYARVSGNACVYGNAEVSGRACISDNARVSGNACISGNACVSGNAVLRQHDEINASNQHFNIVGFTHNITVTYSSIHIGCKSYTWDAFYEQHDELCGDEVETVKYMCDGALHNILENL